MGFAVWWFRACGFGCVLLSSGLAFVGDLVSVAVAGDAAVATVHRSGAMVCFSSCHVVHRFCLRFPVLK